MLAISRSPGEVSYKLCRALHNAPPIARTIQNVRIAAETLWPENPANGLRDCFQNARPECLLPLQTLQSTSVRKIAFVRLYSFYMISICRSLDLHICKGRKIIQTFVPDFKLSRRLVLASSPSRLIWFCSVEIERVKSNKKGNLAMRIRPEKGFAKRDSSLRKAILRKEPDKARDQLFT